MVFQRPWPLGANKVIARQSFLKNGFILFDHVLPSTILPNLEHRVESLFKGQFETKIYPDEWHWRQGISFPHATKEIVNAWKSDKLIASIVLSSGIGKLCCDLLGWPSVRIAQDDIIIKPSQGTPVGFHQDSAYISCQFEQVEKDIPNSITIWFTLNDVKKNSGSLEYAIASHLWPKPQQSIGNFHETDHKNYRKAMFLTYPDLNIEKKN